MKDIQGRLSKLSPAQRALFEKRIRGEVLISGDGQTIPRRQGSGSYPLLIEQEQVWFVYHLGSNTFFLHISTAFLLTGALDVDVLERVINEIVRRHENLRTTFRDVEGHPVPVISPSLKISLNHLDISVVAADKREKRLYEDLAALIAVPFDLSKGPLIRANLVRLSGQEHALQVVMHHIITDRLSIDLLARELVLLYDAFSQGKASPLPDLPIQYSDYAAWHRQWSESLEMQAHLSYWMEKLADPPVLNLLTDYPRPSVQTYPGSRIRWDIPDALWDGIRALSLAENVTRYMTVLALYGVLLSRYTGQKDILIGSPVNNRDRVEIQDIIGYFINILGMRLDLSGNPTFRELLGRVRVMTLEAFAHQELSSAKVVQELRLRRDPSHPPLYQTTFVFVNNIPQPAAQKLALDITPLKVFYDAALVDVALSAFDAEDSGLIALDYNTDLFAHATVERMMGHFHGLMESVVADPARRIAELPMLTAAETEQLLVEWNPHTSYRAEQTLHQLFEQQVRRAPQAVAVIFEDRRLTYSELNLRANQLAHYLRGRGVGAEVTVGIFVERSIEMLIGVLGILKAGGAYVPLETASPKERLAFMLEDARPPVLLTQRHLLERLPAYRGAVVCLDGEAELLARENAEAPAADAGAENLAYIIYTSGSTGQPKGTLMTHRNVTRLFASTRELFDFEDTDVWTLFHSYAFDFSVWEMWGALLYGGRLVVVPYLVSRAPETFYELLEREQVTILNQTPSAFYQLSAVEEARAAHDALGEREGLALRLVIFGGEALELPRLRPWLRRHGDERPRTVNMYGITETTVHVTYRALTGADLNHPARSLIGVPLGDLQVHLLDQHGQLVPIGVPGEMHVSGDGLSRGYLNRPALSAERFVPDSFGAQPGGRLYRTGDLARRLTDGEIEYLGRIDQQVKIRGFRIELGEIESALAQHPALRQVSVVEREDVPGDKRLVAYFVAAVEQPLTTSELRGYLQEKLPDYMIPSVFMPVAEIPLTANGKVDHQALPAPEQSRPALDTSFDEARTPTEEIVCGIWAAVLGVERVGVSDDFFELGGHSLLATQVLSRVRNTFHIEIPLWQIFERSTVAALAQSIDQLRRDATEASVPSLAPAPRHPAPPLSFAQQRLWFLYQLETASAFYNIPLALRLSGALDVTALTRTLSEVVRRHESMRTTFAVVDGLPRQIIHAPRSVELPLADVSGLEEPERERAVEAMVRADAIEPFDLATGPLLRARLLRLSAEEHVLSVTMHHIISDGWSMGVLVREVAALYRAYLQGEESPLAELAIQYADYAVWQRQWLTGAVLDRQLSYWREQLGGTLPVLELPTDRPRPLAQSFRGAHHLFTLPSALTDELKKLSRREGATLFMTLLAAWQALLSRYSGQGEIVVGTAIANRNRAEVEKLIGFFVNTLVIRTDLSEDPNFRELLRRVREVCLGAYAHQDIPFEKVVEELHPERSLSQAPLFQVMFALQNAPMEELQLPGLSLRHVEDDTLTAKFDLFFSLAEAGGELKASLEYSADLFDENTVRRMAEHFQRMLEAVTLDATHSLASLPLLGDAERQQLLVSWNETERAFPPDACIHHLFEERAAETPEAIAVEWADGQLSYRELNRQANQLAHYLRRRGIARGALIGIFMERSKEMLVGLLAALKAGGAYVPLDPSYPAERLKLMLADAGPDALLTQQSLLASLPSSAAQTLCLDTQWEPIAREDEENPPRLTTADDLAYVIYTSGTTGRPKGVQIPHRGVVRLLWQIDYVELDERQSILQMAPISFDASTFEVWAALLYGGRCVLFAERIPTPQQIGAAISRYNIRTLWLTASLFNLVIDEDAAALDGVEQLLIGGEALSVAHVARAQRALPRVRMINGYGPTESTTFTCCYPIPADLDERLKAIPIGKPIANTQVYILDTRLQAVPVGVVGELFIGGDGLARGYLHGPELTAEKFIPHPFAVTPGARLYRTGDRARYLPDGNIEFLGRLDEQVKVRGFRIELGEIETALKQHPAVGEAVAIAREDVPGDKRLVAYVVPDTRYSWTAEQVEELQAEHVEEWQTLYEGTYGDSSDAIDPTFNIIGWNSSYTGQPIPSEEMREWVEETVRRIGGLHPDRVLEIGVGSGLLLFRLATGCSSYLGTDFSPVALDYVKRHLAQSGPRLAAVDLVQRTADDFEGFEARAFDTVILNSVVQYFPDGDYLLKVLEGAVNAVAAGGAIFVGDVRSLSLLEAFHTSVQLQRAEDSLTTARLRQRIQRAVYNDEELVIAPGFFHALKQHLPRISHVAIQPKHGQYHNELTLFRYDVILHVEKETEAARDERALDWRQERLSVSSLRQLLEQDAPSALLLKQVPNARLAFESTALELLRSESVPGTVGELRQAIRDSVTENHLDPKDLPALIGDLPYAFELHYSGPEAAYAYDVLLTRQGDDAIPARKISVSVADEPPPATSLNAYVNNPLRGKFSRQLIPQLRSFLQEQLPEYMMPGNFMVLDALPLTPSGKVDRRALPAPAQTRPELAQEYVGAQTAVEEIVSGTWAEVLGVERVGINDNFFDLGGHSLLATQVVSRLREAFGVEVPLRQLFEKPTVAGLSRYLQEQLSAGASASVPAMEQVDREQRLPLSFAQQRLWFLDQLEPGMTAYNMPLAIKLRGTLEVTALEQTLNEIVRRHEVLRTTFVVGEGEPQQLIHPPQSLTLTPIDLSTLPAAERESKLVQLVRDEAVRPFDLSRGPLLRVRLLRLSADEHVLSVTMHHIISDGWSMGVLVREVAALYEAYLKGEESPLTELPIQYADYSVWQRKWLTGAVLDAQLSYWREQLAGAPPVLELPTDRPRPPVQTYAGAHHLFTLNSELTFSLKELSRRESVTLFMSLLAGFQALLSRYSDQKEIVVGTPIANRLYKQTEELMGFFVNTLALRTSLAGDPTARQLIGRVREVTLGGYAHQEVPFEKLVEELRPERDLSRSPFFQVMFALQNMPVEDLHLPGLTLSPLDITSRTAQFDLTLSMTEVGPEINGLFEYNTDLFERSAIVRLCAHFQRLLAGIVADPQRRVSQLPLLSHAEEQELLLQWNQTATEFPQDRCIHHLFERQAARTPEHPALFFETERLSYRQLNERANQLAHYLRARGVGPESRVGISMERSVEMMVAVLGVLKAGAAYVPLDPNYPGERLSFMLADAQVELLLTQHHLLAKWPECSAAVICVDSESESLARASVENPESGAEGQNLAYLIYTSGSTGQPKGVMIPHAALLNHCHALSTCYALSPADRILQFASLSFDVAAEEIFPTWASGATVVLLPGEALASWMDFGRVIEEARVSALYLSSSFCERWLWEMESEGGSWPQSVRLMAVGSEATSWASFTRWRAMTGSGVRWLSAYGPTETTITATMYEASGEGVGDEGSGARSEGRGKYVPLGRGVGNVRVYVLDEWQEMVGIGMVGELCIGGAGVGRGYVGGAGRTAERYVPDRYSGEVGERMYRSGDLVRYGAGGELEYVGRVDEQVKVRGYRIELGEIEAAVRAHEAIREAVVVAREDGAGQRQLVAYMVLSPESRATFSLAGLRESLRQRLPEFMMPAAFVLLEVMPLTRTGKVDRKALPAPGALQTGKDYVAPRNGTEELVAAIWAELLGAERVSIEDNFFEIGGHSLLATQVISRIRRRLEVELPLQQLFKQPTITKLSELIDQARQSGARTHSPPIRAAAQDLRRSAGNAPTPRAEGQDSVEPHHESK